MAHTEAGDTNIVAFPHREVAPTAEAVGPALIRDFATILAEAERRATAQHAREHEAA